MDWCKYIQLFDVEDFWCFNFEWDAIWMKEIFYSARHVQFDTDAGKQLHFAWLSIAQASLILFSGAILLSAVNKSMDQRGKKQLASLGTTTTGSVVNMLGGLAIESHAFVDDFAFISHTYFIYNIWLVLTPKVHQSDRFSPFFSLLIQLEYFGA